MADMFVIGLSAVCTALILVEFVVYGFDFDELFFEKEETKNEL